MCVRQSFIGIRFRGQTAECLLVLVMCVSRVPEQLVGKTNSIVNFGLANGAVWRIFFRLPRLSKRQLKTLYRPLVVAQLKVNVANRILRIDGGIL